MSAVYVCTLRSTPQRAISLNSCVARCRSCSNNSRCHQGSWLKHSNSLFSSMSSVLHAGASCIMYACACCTPCVTLLFAEELRLPVPLFRVAHCFTSNAAGTDCHNRAARDCMGASHKIWLAKSTIMQVLSRGQGQLAYAPFTVPRMGTNADKHSGGCRRLECHCSTHVTCVKYACT